MAPNVGSCSVTLGGTVTTVLPSGTTIPSTIVAPTPHTSVV